MSGALSRKGILLLTSLLLLAWPCVIWLGLAHNSLRWLLPLMALLLYLRLRQTRRQAGPRVSSPGGRAGGDRPVRGQHAVENAPAAAVLPGGGQRRDAGCVRRFAVDNHAAGGTPGPHTSASPPRRRRALYPSGHADLVPVFIVNGSIALFTALYGDMALWTAWNGMIAYLLIGALMAGEWLVRRRVIKRESS